MSLGDIDGVAIGGIDYNSCRTETVLDEWTAPLLAKYGSYTEVSPSGSGIKTFFRYDAAALPQLLLAMGTKSGKSGRAAPESIHRGSSSILPADISLSRARSWPNSQEELQSIPKESIEELIRVDGPAVSGTRKPAEAQGSGGGECGEPWSDGPWVDEEASDVLRARVAAAADSSPRMKRLYDGDSSDLQDKSRSGAAMAMARHLYNAGFGIEEIVPFLRSWSETADWIAEKDADPTCRELKRLWATISKEPRKRQLDGSEFGTGETAPRELPEVRIDHGTRTDHLRAAEDALLAGEHGLYQQNTRVVRVAATRQRLQTGQTGEVQTAVEVSDTYLCLLMERAARFTRFDGRKKERVSCLPPLDIARAYLAMSGHEWRLPTLKGLIQAPALRPDGSILDQPGYDAVTELVFDPQGEVFPPISACPTRGEAAAALASLGELISEFPFVTTADRAVALSAILTAVARPTMQCAPMHAFSATEPGTGKGLLALVASVIATGAPAPAANYSRSEDEVSKVVGTALMQGAPIFCLDNIEHELKGTQLCTAITEPTPSIRVSGRSENVTVKSRTFFPCDRQQHIHRRGYDPARYVMPTQRWDRTPRAARLQASQSSRRRQGGASGLRSCRADGAAGIYRGWQAREARGAGLVHRVVEPGPRRACLARRGRSG